jgi:Ca2+-transporting ATPase
VLAVAAVEATVVLAVFTWGLRHGGLVLGRDLAFTTLVLAELLRAFAARSERLTLWEVGAVSNLRLVLVVAASAGLQLALYGVDALGGWLYGGTLEASHLVVALAAALVPVSVLELAKLARRSVRRARAQRSARLMHHMSA